MLFFEINKILSIIRILYHKNNWNLYENKNTFMKSFFIILGIITLISFNVQAQEFVWAHSAGGGDIYNSGIATDKNGNSYITGNFRPKVTFGSIQIISHGDRDIYVAKYDSTGKCLWAESAGGISGDMGDGIAVDANGFVYLTGLFYSTAMFDTIQITAHCNGNNMFLAKYDSMGHCIWVSQASSGTSLRGFGVSADRNGYSFVTGYFTDTAKLGSTQLISYGGEDIFVAKYDPNGNCLWAKHAGGKGISYDVGGYAVTHDSNDNVYITGIFEDTAKFENIELISAGD